MNPLETNWTFHIVRQFFDQIQGDPHIGPTHIALFMAMVRLSGSSITFSCYGRELRNIAKINSSRTYHKILRDLRDGNYIIYVKGRSHWVRSTIHFIGKECIKQ